MPLAGVKTSLVGGPIACVTDKVALALLRPAADAVIVAVPAVLGVKVDDAVPLDGVTGESGLKEPDTPLATKVIGFVALATVLPYLSRMVAS